ncbi:response regulator transcription factor [Clostridium sartagoforme]|uniref:Stage 0 sporulation protein A homolog n=1 Tax=Clostridium sartagoforme TaxID=84031 RepID=A0A4S2DMK0_9CLOT|nr:MULTISPECIES: response regulator transcription factor [Clostridium]MBS5937840.1 response regulator transcription factor [Clostridium sp.]TGY42293.1 response regulator transcription factor [Clostridium sartagoforme]
MSKILIVEDEKQISKVMKLYLEKEGYNIELASDGKIAEELIENNIYDLVILDIMMPYKDGWYLLKKVKSLNKMTQVIITSARGEEEDRIFGLELGADDYMVKPISMRELVLRVSLRLKSTLKETESEINIGKLNIDENNRRVFEKGEEVILTPKEYELMIFFVKNKNRVFSREDLILKVWGYDFFGDTRTVDTHIKKLREKIEVFKDNLKTIWRVGYSLTVEDE